MKTAPISPADRYGFWTVVSVGHGKKSLCRCDCGTEKLIHNQSLREGRSRSCGCQKIGLARASMTKHGAAAFQTRAPEYIVWMAMKARCNNPRNPRFADYGGRGIKVCAEWEANFAAFIVDVGPRPSARHSINRLDNDRGYEPGNVVWSLPSDQMTNRRNTQFVMVDGQQVPLASLARESGIPANTLRFRLLNGWPIDRALREPVRAKRAQFTR